MSFLNKIFNRKKNENVSQECVIDSQPLNSYLDEAERVCMAAYILLRFRDISFSVGAFASVATTTFCIISFYTLLWKVLPFSMEVDQTFIAAILTIIG